MPKSGVSIPTTPPGLNEAKQKHGYDIWLKRFLLRRLAREEGLNWSVEQISAFEEVELDDEDVLHDLPTKLLH